MEVGSRQDGRHLDEYVRVAGGGAFEGELQGRFEVFFLLFGKADDEAERRNDPQVGRFANPLEEDFAVDVLANEGKSPLRARIDNQ